jgi:hypothetical protein
MIKDIKKISDLLKLEDQKKDFNKDLLSIINIIKQKTGIVLEYSDIFIKNNIVKIKTISNIRFFIFLNLKEINKELFLLNKNFILEL